MNEDERARIHLNSLNKRVRTLEDSVASGFIHAGTMQGAAIQRANEMLDATIKEERTARLASEQELRDHFDQVVGDLADEHAGLIAQIMRRIDSIDRRIS